MENKRKAIFTGLGNLSVEFASGPPACPLLDNTSIQTFQSLKGAGFKSNYYDETTGEDYWISGPKRRGGDRMYGSVLPVEIDEDVRVEYWRDIRGQPERLHEKVA